MRTKVYSAQRSKDSKLFLDDDDEDRIKHRKDTRGRG